MTKLIYAGIGSRETPPEMCEAMTSVAKDLAPHWILRSGFADGADNAFAWGAEHGDGEIEIFVPWHGFNKAPTDDERVMVPEMTPQLLALAARYHPAWDRCSPAARRLHARNGCQIFGKDLKTPVNMVICWTKDGAGGGGTGQAIRIAKDYNIPVFDLFWPAQQDALCEFVAKAEAHLTPVSAA